MTYRQLAYGFLQLLCAAVAQVSSGPVAIHNPPPCSDMNCEQRMGSVKSTIYLVIGIPLVRPKWRPCMGPVRSPMVVYYCCGSDICFVLEVATSTVRSLRLISGHHVWRLAARGQVGEPDTQRPLVCMCAWRICVLIILFDLLLRGSNLYVLTSWKIFCGTSSATYKILVGECRSRTASRPV